MKRRNDNENYQEDGDDKPVLSVPQVQYSK